MGWNTEVGVATRYGLDGAGIESRWGQNIPRLSSPALGPTQRPIKWVPEIKRQGRGVNTQPHLALRLKKELSYTSTPALGPHGLL